jgi:hypothetical protein
LKSSSSKRFTEIFWKRLINMGKSGLAQIRWAALTLYRRWCSAEGRKNAVQWGTPIRVAARTEQPENSGGSK